MTDVTLHQVAAEYVSARDRVAQYDAKLKAAKAAADAAEEALLQRMIDEGAPSVEVLVGTDGTKARIYPQSKLWARRNPEVDEATFFEALAGSDLGDLIRSTVHTQSLSSAIREIAEDNGTRDQGEEAILGGLPPALRAVVSVSTKPALAMRKAGKK